MPRAAASIQAEITAIEAQLQASDSLYTALSGNNVQRTIDRKALEARLEKLYRYLDRAGGEPMTVRGRVKGLW